MQGHVALEREREKKSNKKKNQKKKTWSFLIIANLIFTTPTPYCIMDAFGTVSLQDSVGISQ